MAIKVDYRRSGTGTYIEIDKGNWQQEKFGLFNSRKKGELDPEDLEELEEKAGKLEYGETSNGVLERIGQRIYGGAIQTPHGTCEWLGEIPEDVEEYLEEVRNSGIG